MKLLILLICALALPGLAQAWSGDHGRGTQGMFHEMQRRAYEQDQEWRRRGDEQRRRAEEEQQRELWRRDEQRRRENALQQEERARDWGQRRAYEEQRQERFQQELLQRDETREGGRSGSYREPGTKGKPLAPRELRRYELIKPGERP